MPRSFRSLFALLFAVLLIGAPVSYAYYRHAQIRNFRTVRDEVLYRSGQLSQTGLKKVIHDYGIRTVITLRAAELPGELPPDAVEENYCRAQELNYYRIPQRSWWAAEGPAPADKGVRQFCDILSDPRHYPVLVHCLAGIHRTGAYVAIYRMEFEHWGNQQAIAEMKACGYSNLDDEWDVLGYVESFRPSWDQERKPSTPRRPPSKPGKQAARSSTPNPG